MRLSYVQIKTPKLGDPGRWLTSGDVAQQLRPTLPYMREAIVLAYAKDPANPDTLSGKQQRGAQKVVEILETQQSVYMIQVAAVMMEWVFVPLYEAIGRQEHTQFGGKDGVIKTYQRCKAQLQRMVERHDAGRRRVASPSREYFGDIIDSTAAQNPDLERECKQQIVSHVRHVEHHMIKRYGHVERFQYRVAHLVEEEWVLRTELQCYVLVPTADALQDGANLVLEFDTMSPAERGAVPEKVRAIFQQGGQLRQQLDEFLLGTSNKATGRPYPLRNWRLLSVPLTSFVQLLLNASAYCEGRFSVASNAAKVKPNCTTRALSGIVRRRSNHSATQYPSAFRFTDLDPEWKLGDPVPSLRRRDSHVRVPIARSFVSDFERLEPTAKQLIKTMKPIYTANHMASFYRKNEARQDEGGEKGLGQEEDPPELYGDEDENSDSDDDLPLQYIGLAEDELPLQVIHDSCHAEIQGRTWRRGSKKSETLYDEDGNEVALEENPLANLRANYVWESLSDGIRVMLEGPLKRPPDGTTAFEKDTRRRGKYKFYSRMRVQDEFGDVFWFDLREDRDSMAVVFYDIDSASGDKILWYADLLAIYVNPSGEPMVEHGYLFDRSEIARDRTCKKFLKATERGPAGRIAENELVNCNNVYHTHASCIEGKETLVHSHAPPPNLPQGAFFWRRAVDLLNDRECAPSLLSKAVRIVED